MKAQEPLPAEMLEAFEIIAVQNGWIMRPSIGNQMSRGYTDRNEMHVFRSVEEMTAWMLKSLPRHA